MTQFTKIYNLTLVDMPANVTLMAWMFKSFFNFGVDHCGNAEPILSFYVHALVGLTIRTADQTHFLVTLKLVD